MPQKKSSASYRRQLNRLIKFCNRRLPGSEQIESISTVPFLVSNRHMEAVVWEYDAFYYDWMADWHDNGSVRADEIRVAMDSIVEKHGDELREYLAPYKGVTSYSYSESHCVRLAEKLFGK
jgi:hypothetical protein